MLENGWKRLLSGLLALVLVIGMLPPVTVAAEETEATVQETESAETGSVATEAVTEPVGTTETAAETEETIPETTAETVAETTEETEPALPENVAAVQALIDALPDMDSVTAEDYDAVQDAYDAYDALTEEEKALIQGVEKFEGLFNWFNSQTATLAITASGTCGNNVTWVLTDDWTLTISGTGDMNDYNAYRAPWYDSRNNITAVIIEDGVTSIGKRAFYGCCNLASVTISKDVVSIGAGVFEYCSSLTSITIPEGVTRIGASAFEYCSNLTDITIPNTVTSIEEHAFYDCKKLDNVILPIGVASIENDAFHGCSSLTNITIPESVTNIGGS